MTKWTVQTLALAFMAAPLVLVGCGSSSGGGTGGSMGVGGAIGAGGAGGKDAGGTGGVRVDAGQPDAVSSPDLGSTPDVGATVDLSIFAPDVAAPLDVASPDVAVAIDVTSQSDAPAAVDASEIDSGTAVDTSPVVCTETTPFTGGDVTTKTTLTKACSPYDIQNDINVGNNAVLTIEAGATLNFEQGTTLNVGVSTSGQLVAVGTAQSPILLTSAATTPSAGDWAGIYFGSATTGGNQVAYTKVDYCGSNSDGCIVGSGVKASQPSRVAIDHVTIDHVGAAADGIDETDPTSNFTITNSTFSNIPVQQYAISVQAPSFAGIGAGNTFNGVGPMIEIQGGVVGATASWVNPGTSIAVTWNDLQVDGTGSPILTLGPGMTLMFDQDLGFDIGPSAGGQLQIAGTAAQSVVLTSLAASPSQGDWDGVQIYSGGKATIDHAKISYGGSGDASYPGDIVIENDSTTPQLTVTNSSLTNSAGYGIYVPCAYSSTVPTAATNTFTGNATGDIGPGPVGADCP